MADVQQNVIIEFITNDEQLKSSEERLVALGKTEKSNADQFKAANTEINKQVQSLKNLETVNSQINKSGTSLKRTIADVATQVKGMSGVFQKEFKAGAAQALKEAGVSAEQFEKALEGVGAETTSLRQQLRNMTQSLAQMKVEGKDNTEQYRQLAQQAGQLRDAINDANQEVKNFGSDTSTFDGLIQSVQGVAGGFAVMQGASALFGEESEELQKTLLRVNAAMAILQGLQQIQIVLQKESAAATLASTIATRAQTVATIAFNFVVGKSVGLLKAFKIALAATGVGLLLIGLGKLVEMMMEYGDETEKSTELTDAFTKSLDNLASSASDAADEIERRTDINIANLEKLGAKESALNVERLKSIEDRRAAELRLGEELSQKTIELNNKAREGLITEEDYKKAMDALNAAVKRNQKAIIDLNHEEAVAVINNQKTIADERKKAFEDAQKRAKEALEREKELRAAGFADAKAAIEREILASEEGSEKQLALKKKLLFAELQIALDNEKLTQNQKLLLEEQFGKDVTNLHNQFNKDRSEKAIQDHISGYQADIDQLEITNEQKLRLTEQLLIAQAQLEINAANGNAAKIAEINAKRDKAIRDARIASIQAAADYEIRLATATNGPEQRRLQRVVANNDAELADRISAIDELARLDSQAVSKKIEALNKEREQKLISEEEYKLRYAELVDEQTKIFEDAEQKKTDTAIAESEKRKQATIREIQEIIEVANTVVGVLDALYSLQSQSENNRIAEQKQRLKDLQDAGAITEKEALSRQKRIEAEERKIRQAQAQREKQVAVFNAALAIPQAFLKGLTQGGLILAGIYGGLAAIQFGIVASRPIPKFGKGKKDKYQGLAEVGETGAELIQRDGKMYLAPSKTITYLGSTDKVFNPVETAAMLSKPSMNTERIEILPQKTNGYKIDYEKMGKEVGKHLKTNVYVDGVQKQTIEKHLFTEWMDKRRSL